MSDTFTPWVPEMEQRMEQITSALALRAAHYLARIRRYSDATVKVSQGRIAAALNATAEGVRKALNVLRDAGLISWTTRHRHASTYTLLYVHPSDAEARRRRQEPEASPETVTPTRVGSTYPTGVGTISQMGTLSQKKAPPNPPAGDLADERVPDVSGGDIPTELPASGGVDADPADAGAGAEVAAAPVIDEIGDESAGWCDRAAARRRAARLVPVEPKMTRQSVDELVAAACVVGEGEAVLAPSGSLPSRDGSALPLTPGAAERAVAGLLGPDSGHHGAYAASRVARLAGLGDLTDRMLARAAAEATDARGVGCTRLVALVCRELHTARLSARWARRIDERREARRLADEAPVGGRVACPA